MPTTTTRPLFTADWLDVIFVHFRMPPERLQPLVPLELDTFEGDAFVSLVAFTQHELRPFAGGRLGRLGRLLAAPLAQHEFLNVRTYVRRRETRGIYFMTEWIPNRLAALIGPHTYGLPYRLGRFNYRRRRRREVISRGQRLSIEALEIPDVLTLAGPATLDAFLLERYTAFTHREWITRRFDVDHVPWPQARVDVLLDETDLLRASGDWLDSAELAAAHYSPGVRGVTIGWPRRVDNYSATAAAGGCAISASRDQ